MANTKRQRQKQGRELRRQALAATERRRRFRRSLITALAVTGVFALLYSVLLKNDETKQATTKDCPPAQGTSAPVLTFQGVPPQCISPDKKYTAVFDTSEGTFEVELDNTTTPTTANNFVFLVRNHYYDNTKIFRLDETIDIWQSGSPHTQSAADEGPGYHIPDEGNGNFQYAPGDLVMARGSQGGDAQYFFVTGPDSARLSQPIGAGNYVPFGKTTKGLDVVQRILSLHNPDPSNTYNGPPNKDVVIRTITIRES